VGGGGGGDATENAISNRDTASQETAAVTLQQRHCNSDNGEVDATEDAISNALRAAREAGVELDL